MYEIGNETLVHSLLDLLARAGAEINGDRESARTAISKASSILRVELERSSPSALTAEPRGLPSWQVRRVTAYIDTHLEEHIPMAALSGLVQLSASHFCRAFKRTMGETPYRFITRRRVAAAERLMLTSEAPLSEIAIRCGFSDQPHFCNRFREATGQSPAAWRRERRQLTAHG